MAEQAESFLISPLSPPFWHRRMVLLQFLQVFKMEMFQPLEYLSFLENETFPYSFPQISIKFQLFQLLVGRSFFLFPKQLRQLQSALQGRSPWKLHLKLASWQQKLGFNGASDGSSAYWSPQSQIWGQKVIWLRFLSNSRVNKLQGGKDQRGHPIPGSSHSPIWPPQNWTWGQLVGFKFLSYLNSKELLEKKGPKRLSYPSSCFWEKQRLNVLLVFSQKFSKRPQKSLWDSKTKFLLISNFNCTWYNFESYPFILWK